MKNLINYSGIVYHKTTLEGFFNLVENYNEFNSICCSTPLNTTSLINKYGSIEVVVTFIVKQDEYIYSSIDYDANKYYGYDEIRVSFKNQEELIDSIQDIYLQENFNSEELDDDSLDLFENLYNYIRPEFINYKDNIQLFN